MEKIITDKAPQAIGPYSQGYAANGFVFSSGQIPVDPATGLIVEGGIREQARRSCINVGEVLKAAGSSYGKVVKTTCFLSDMSDFAEFNKVYEEFFVSAPARSCVAVKDLPKGALCEIEAIALG